MTLLLLLATLLLTACYDYDHYLHEAEEQSSLEQRLANADSLYLNFRITNTSDVTRATEAGTTDENAIYDGILCIFEGSDAATATLKTATVIDQLISNPNPSGATPRVGGTETAVNITQRLAEGTHAYGSNLYALVLLNTTESGFKVNGNRLYHNGNSQYQKTLAQVKGLTLNSVGSIDEHVGLFMSNAELVAIIPASHLFDTEKDAADHFSSGHIEINVARVAARIRVTNGVPASMALSNINLHGISTVHPLIHHMTWALASELPGYTEATGANVFSLFHQHSHESGEAVYVPETSSAMQIIVEVQLKDESNVLLGDCYSFPSLSGSNLYTSVDELITFYKGGWDGWPYQRWQEDYAAISSWSADEVFRNTKVTMFDDGSIKVSLLTDENYTSTTVTDAQRIALKKLEDVLSGFTQGYRDGKMYYTYTIPSLERNNAYNLSLVEQGGSDTRYVAVTFNYQNGQGWTAAFSNSSADLFANSRVVTGSNMNYYGWDANFGQAKYNPTAEHSSPSADDNIDFLIDPEEGWEFVPSRVAFNTTRYGTDGGRIDVYWLNSGLTTNVSLDTEVEPYRNNQTVNVLNWSKSVTAGSVGDGECGLRLLLYKLKETKQVGFSDIVISGTLTKTSTESSQKSINGVGRPTP